MKSVFLQKLKANIGYFKDEIKPKTKEELINFGILKSSDDLPPPENKQKKRKDKELKI